jgi:hypothetical protein
VNGASRFLARQIRSQQQRQRGWKLYAEEAEQLLSGRE